MAEACEQLVESLTWESPELQAMLLQLSREQDGQLLALFKTLKNQPSSFLAVVSKYGKVRLKPTK
jgi:hypothetical protein